MAYEEDETCGWPFDEGCWSPPDTMDAGVLRIARNLTVSTLRMLTLFRVGGCPVTVRPCVTPCTHVPHGAMLGSAFTPHISATGQWVNGCGCGSACGPSAAVTLPGPIGRVDQVVVDGQVLDPSAYRVDNGNQLLRTDGQLWPLTQSMDLPPTEPGTFAVTYLNAYVPDDAAAYAASLLLKEFAKACQGESCSLSPRVTSVARRGISAELREAVFTDGKTGIPAVDSWIMTWNPGLLRQRPRVYSPDVPAPRVTTLP